MILYRLTLPGQGLFDPGPWASTNPMGKSSFDCGTCFCKKRYVKLWLNLIQLERPQLKEVILNRVELSMEIEGGLTEFNIHEQRLVKRIISQRRIKLWV